MVMRRGEFLAELKLPAEPEYISAAKRVASCLGSTLGFSLEELDDLSIAIAQACDSTIEACADIWGPSSGAQIKVSYGKTEKGIAVEVEGIGPSPEQQRERALAEHRERVIRQVREQDREMQRMAQEMIRFFVDDFRSSVDAGRGRVHLRMVKYLLG
jgi:anti-sigma regulatory factor (Ser/Thr protein kinase)